MKYYILLIAVISALSTNAFGQIIDRHNVRAGAVPAAYVESARNNLKIFYGHTSHGSQLITGMTMLKASDPVRFGFNSGEGTLNINDSWSIDLGNPDFRTWAETTRAELSKPSANYNVVMWAWCGELSWASEDDVNTYLNLMTELEKDFPSVKFVYFTGHLDGTGSEGTLNKNNEKIRLFCRSNNKSLFDFADIESWSPDGVCLLDKSADDACNYYSDGVLHNWADEYCSAHPSECELCAGCTDCAHSRPLNCLRKGNAAWELFASLSGWDGKYTGVDSESPISGNNAGLSVSPNPTGNTVSLSFELSHPARVSISIYDLQGNEVIKALDGKDCPSGPVQIESISLSGLPAGVYECVLTAGKTVLTKTVTVKK